MVADIFTGPLPTELVADIFTGPLPPELVVVVEVFYWPPTHGAGGGG